MKPCRLFFTSLLAITVFAAQAQGGRDNAGGLTLPVGQTSAVQTATLTFTSATTPGTPFTINVLTQGSPNLDFNLALNNSVPAGTCSATATYAIGDTCTVAYTFSPHFPGIRHGGISLTIGTTPLANTYLNGTGLGPQSTFSLPQQVAHGGDLYYPESTAIDGAGNIYVASFFGSTLSAGNLYRIGPGCRDVTCVQFLYGFDSFIGANGGANPEAIAVDGSGNLYVAFEQAGLGHYLYEIPKGCTSYSCAYPLGDTQGSSSGVVGEPLALAVDGNGNVYVNVADTNTPSLSSILKIPPGCASATCIVTLLQSATSNPYALATDQNANVYFVGPDNTNPNLPSVIYQIPNGCTAISCTVQVSPPGISPGISLEIQTIALDGTGNFFYNDANHIYEIPSGCKTTSCVLNLNPQTPFAYIYGVQMDGRGNPYVILDDNKDDAVYELDLVDPPTLTFPLTAQGQVSPAQTVTVGNNGNEPLLFTPSITQPNPTISQYFQLDNTSSGTCGALIAASTAPALAPAQLCTLPLDFAPLAPAIGTVNGTAVLTDNSLNVLNATQTIPLVGTAVLPGTTFLTLTSSLNPAFAGIGVTFTAQLTSPSGTPTGSVTFTGGATVLATVPVSGAAAAFTTSSLTPGTHTITATFTPTGIYLASNASLSQLITPDTALATISAAPASALVGAPVAVSVALSGTPAGPTPTGTVTFTSNGAPIGTAAIVNGVASLTTTTLAAGTDSLTCTYSGDGNYAADNCANTLNESILTQAVATRLSLASSLNPANALQPLSFSTTLTFGRSFLNGVQITLTIDGAVVGTGITGANGQSTFALPAGLGPGRYTVTATSAASGIYISSTATLTEIVSTAPTTTALQSSLVTGPTGVTTGTFTATVSGSLTDPNNGPLTPTGSVTFSINGIALATVPLNGTTAVYTSSTLPVGSDAATCAYSGDINFAPSLCNTTQFIIQPPTPPDFTVTLAPPALTVPTGQSASTQVMLQSIAGFNGTVTLTCGKPLPPLLSCTFDQTQLNLSANGNASTRLVLKTDAIAANRPPDFWPESSRRIQLAALLPLSLLSLLGLSRSRRRNGLFRLLVLTVCLTAGTVSGCGGGYASFTPPGTYSIPVTASTSTTTHSATLSLSVVP